MTEPIYDFYVFSDEQLASTIAGASGARKIGVSAISGISGSDVQAVLAELAALSGTTPASETVAGIVELATAGETQTGTDNTRAVHPSGLASLTGTETRRGLLELATAAETQTGTDATRAAHPAGLKSTLDARTSQIGSFLAGDGPTVWSNFTLSTNTKHVSSDLRGVGGVPSDAKGVFLGFRADAVGTNRLIYIDSADAPLTSTNSIPHWCLGSPTSGQYAVPLGTGANAGKIAVLNDTAGTPPIWAWVTGWWK
jgi:hypothetical protein